MNLYRLITPYFAAFLTGILIVLVLVFSINFLHGYGVL